MMEFFVPADNVFNRVNYGGYSGNELSDYFWTADDGAAPAAGAGRDAVPVLDPSPALSPQSPVTNRNLEPGEDRRQGTEDGDSHIEFPM